MSDVNAGREAALAAAIACGSASTRVAVLVEGESDRAAVRTVAARAGRDLDAACVAVVPMSGATNIGHFAEVLGGPGLGLRLAGLYDEAEEPHVRRGLRQAGLDPAGGRAALRNLGFHACVADLEDELIRALGHGVTESLIEAQGDLRSLRRFQAMPAQRGRPAQAQLRRFLGTRSGRKIHYGAVLAGALDLGRLPRPLDGLLAQLPW